MLLYARIRRGLIVHEPYINIVNIIMQFFVREMKGAEKMCVLNDLPNSNTSLPHTEGYRQSSDNHKGQQKPYHIPGNWCIGDLQA